MSFRRNTNKHDAWRSWLEEKKALLARVGLPGALLDSESRFREFLTCGQALTAGGSVVRLRELSADEFSALLAFVLAVHPLSDDMERFDALEERRIHDAG